MTPVRIPLRNSQGIAAYAMVDSEDSDLAALSWQMTKTRGPYACRRIAKDSNGRRPTMLMHRVVLSRMGPLPAGYVTDHVNGDKLDNRRSNLRVATAAQNGHNVGKRRDNSTGFKGVTFYRHIGKWCARIRVNKASKFLGTFTSAEAAHDAYKAASALYHGPYGRV